MSRINDLINKLCPNGVQYRNIKELCIDNFWVMPATPSYQNDGIPYVTSKNIRNGIVNFDDIKYISKEDYESISSNRPIKENDFLISMIGTIGEVGIVKSEDLPFYGQNMYLLRLDPNLINIRFFYHYFISDKVKNLLMGEKNNGNQGYLKTKNIETLKVPVPPLEIQNEMANIFDKFGELESELESELEARKNQYDFWREKLCGGEISSLKEQAKKGTIKLNKLNEVGTLTRGKRFVKADAVESGASCIHYGELYTYYGISAIKTKSYIREELAKKLRFAEKGDVVIVGAGENNIDIGIGVAWLGDEKPAIHDACYIFKHSLNPKYVSYYLRTKLYHNQLKSWVSEGKICAVSAKGIGECFMPIPTIEKQNEIVKILDKFEKLINDISVGIPAEIDLRRKQYEYYRNKLFSFEELSVSE